jgi:ABC-type glucose/galactose transport system permease subunit
MFLDQTSLSLPVKHAACAAMVVGILAQSGGFFIHLFPERASLGTRVTLTGAVILVGAIAVLIYGLLNGS